MFEKELAEELKGSDGVEKEPFLKRALDGS